MPLTYTYGITSKTIYCFQAGFFFLFSFLIIIHIQMMNIVNWNQSPESRYGYYLTWNRVRKISHWVHSFTVLYQVRLTKLMYMSYTMYIERKNIHDWFSDHYIIDYVTCLWFQGHSANPMTSLYQYLELAT